MKKIATLVILSCCLLMINCEEDEGNKDFKASIKNDVTPVVINSDHMIRFSSSGLGDEEVEYTLSAPWTMIIPKFENTGEDTITIVSGSALITGPDGITRKKILSPISSCTGDPTTYFSVVEPACTDASPPSDCGVRDLTFTANLECDTSSLGTFLYLTNMLEGVDQGEQGDIKTGASYGIELVLEGWRGKPNEPKSNFLHRMFFNAVANY